MAEAMRISVDDAREAVQSDRALLVCAYDDEQKCNRLRLEGAITLSSFQSMLSSLPKDQEIIFYCA